MCENSKQKIKRNNSSKNSTVLYKYLEYNQMKIFAGFFLYKVLLKMAYSLMLI